MQLSRKSCFMKKIIYSVILAVALMACSKEKSLPEYPSLAGVFSQQSFFAPAYIHDQDAPPLALNQPIVLQYFSKAAYPSDFTILEGNVFLANVSPAVDHITASNSGYNQVGFPANFKVPELWAGKLITIIPNDGTNAFTKFRVMELGNTETTDY